LSLYDNTCSFRKFISTVFNFLFTHLTSYKSKFYGRKCKEYPKNLSKEVENTYLACNAAAGFYETIDFCHITNCFAVNVFSSIELSVVKVLSKALSTIRMVLNLVYAMIIVRALLLEEGSLGLVTWR